MVGWVPRLIHDLWANRFVVWVHGSSDRRGFCSAVESQDHIRSGDPLRIPDVPTLLLSQNRGCERHPKVSALYHVVDDLDDFPTRRVGQDGAVAESASAE